MRTSGILFRTLFCVAMASTAVPEAADVCSCVWRDDGRPGAVERLTRQQFGAADAVFVAEVVAVSRGQATMRVVRTWKGRVPAVIVMGTGTVRTRDGLLQTHTCVLDFHGAEGAMFLVSADAPPGERMTAHRCGPTIRLQDAAPVVAALDGFAAAAEPPPLLQQDDERLRADLDLLLSPVAAWRQRISERLRAIANTHQADAELLSARLEVKKIVATLAPTLEGAGFQRRIWPDGAAGQAYARVQGKPLELEAPTIASDALVRFMKERGVWPQRAEGDTHFAISEGALLAWFGAYVSAQIREFLQLWADEQAAPAAEDASIQVPLDTLEDRILRTERFLADFPESPVGEPVRSRHQFYLSLYLGGTDNTRAFDPATGVLREDLRARFEGYRAAHGRQRSGRIVAEYLELLRTTGFKRTSEIRRLLESVRPKAWQLLRY